MKHKPSANTSSCKVISFKNYKNKKVKNVSSTIAAIIAINIDHPSDTTPEDFFINEIESIENIEVLAEEVNDGLIQIQLEYTIRTTNTRSNFVYPFYFQEGTNVSV